MLRTRSDGQIARIRKREGIEILGNVGVPGRNVCSTDDGRFVGIDTNKMILLANKPYIEIPEFNNFLTFDFSGPIRWAERAIRGMQRPPGIVGQTRNLRSG